VLNYTPRTRIKEKNKKTKKTNKKKIKEKKICRTEVLTLIGTKLENFPSFVMKENLQCCCCI
jgi:hypothetical protein